MCDLQYTFVEGGGNMAKFCIKCGAKLDSSTGKCLNCDGNQTSNGKKKRKILKKFLMVVVFLGLCVGIPGSLYLTGIIKIPEFPWEKQNESLADINKECIEIEEKEITMESDTEGIAEITITIPDYEELYMKAYTKKDPDRYLIKALKSGDYSTQTFKKIAKVTIKEGKEQIHSEEVVDEVLEEALVGAINSLTEDETWEEE